MTDLIARLARAAIAAVVLAGGCSPSSSPAAWVGNSAGAAIPSPTVTPSEQPRRPRELRLDGLDPCALVAQSAWVKLYIEKVYQRKSNKCFYSSNRASLLLDLVTHEGIEAWQAGTRLGRASDMAPIADFPAISVQLPERATACSALVDVAGGQYLLAQAVPTYRIAELPEKCEYARQLAEAAMETLVAIK